MYFIIHFGKFGSPCLSKAAAATRAPRPSPISGCWVFPCFRNPPNIFCFLFFSCVQCFCFHTTGCKSYSFTTDGYGVVNMRTHVGAVHTNKQANNKR